MVALLTMQAPMPSPVHTSPAAILESLRPTTKTNVIDLVAEAGVDVSPWHFRADGTAIDAPAENPSYCYDWAFGSTFEHIVLCVWHGSLAVDGDTIVYAENMRKLGTALQRIAADQKRDAKDRDRARQQTTRARNFDEQVKAAYERFLAVRLIINEGNQASREQLGVASSKVLRRELDGESWFVHDYDEDSGECRLVRGVRPANDLPDQGTGDEESKGPDDARQIAAIRVRRGQRAFRENLLSAWNRRCVVTESRIVELLEAAHIVPHAEDTDYRTSNGLLLRADIHTLYDLHLLSINQFMRVHLAESVRNTEYRQYDGKKVERRPERGADAPSIEALQQRHQRFLDAQVKR